MKNWLVAVLLLCTSNTEACDICGAYLNLYPQDRSNFISLMYRHRTLSGTLNPVISEPKHGAVDEFQQGEYLELYSTMELRANYFLAENVSLLAVIPVINRYRSVDRNRMADTYGVSDPILMANVILANTMGDESFSGVRHRVTVGAGVKMPFGRTDVRYNGELLDRDMQAGSGTWDALFAVTYSIRRSDFGIGLQWMGALTSPDAEQSRYGNNHNFSIEPFYLIQARETTISPFIGAYAETYADEVEFDQRMDGTGGTVFFSKTGLRVWRGKWSAQAETQIALAEERAETVPPNRFRIVAGISYFL